MDELSKIVTDTERLLQPTADSDFDTLQHYLLRLQNGRSGSEFLIGLSLLQSDVCESIDVGHKMKVLSNSLQCLCDKVEKKLFSECMVRPNLSTWSPNGRSLRTGSVGRPRLLVNIEQIEYLKSWNFSWTRISYTLCVSRTTLWRRLKESGYPGDTSFRFTNISSDDLEGRIREIKTNFPYIGERLVIGHLRARGIHVQRHRTREIIRRIDPINTALRWNAMHARVRYNVPGPNALWHIDGLHRLIRWGFVVHGGIDGYSRLVTFLDCSTNNRASTVLRLFEDATQRYGIPSRVRADFGVENAEVKHFMNSVRGENRGSYLEGSSVHNQRIERLHRDTTRCCLTTFYNAFTFLEEEHLLDVTNETDVFCLHHVFLPRIKRAIQEFRLGWNHHSLSSEGNQTPYQLWIQGVISDEYSGFTAVHDITNPDLITYGVDFSADLSPQDDDSSCVEVFEPTCPLTSDQLLVLNGAVNPLAPSAEDGVDIFTRCLSVVNEIMQS